jgi:hypothetical protein
VAKQHVLCPDCNSERTRRSKRRGVKDQFMTLFGLRPWRCRMCNARFYGWSVPASYALYAHCRQCGNFDLERVRRERVTRGVELMVTNLLHVPAYRCDHCRERFFSYRPFRRIVPVRAQSSPVEEAAPTELPGEEEMERKRQAR